MLARCKRGCRETAWFPVSGTLPRTVEKSLNVTLPVAPEVTVAVNVIDVPWVTTVFELERVVVDAAGEEIMMLNPVAVAELTVTEM